MILPIAWGCRKKHLYQYYADKDELVDAVVDGHIKVIQTDCLGCRHDATGCHP